MFEWIATHDREAAAALQAMKQWEATYKAAYDKGKAVEPLQTFNLVDHPM